MSRTYRRVNRDLPEWITHDWKPIDGVWKDIPYEGKKLKKIVSIQYTDNGCCIDGNDVPAHYRKTINREFRAKMKQEVRRILKQHDYENYSFNLYRNTVAWDWY